jgi:hypothetical protein
MLPTAHYRVANLRTGLELAWQVQRASSVRKRMVGLLGRARLAAGEGLWIDPCRAIHMFFMRFAIDAVFLAPDFVVTRAVSRLGPWRIAVGGRRTRSVIELPAGTLEATDTRAGDRLEIALVNEPPEPRPD